MANEPQQTVTAEQLMALRSGPDALRTISDALQVKKMGPSDHIRTKHEVKQFLQSGTINRAEQLVLDASRRLMNSLKQHFNEKMNQTTKRSI